MFPNKIQYFISNYYIFDIIPLDKTLHVLLGGIITIILRKFNFRIAHVFMILAIICFIKEVIDSKTLGSTITESIADFTISFVYPVLVLIIIKIKSSEDEASK